MGRLRTVAATDCQGGHLVDSMYPAGVEQYAFCKGGLAGVYVRRNTDVADVAQLLLRVLLKRWQRTE